MAKASYRPIASCLLEEAKFFIPFDHVADALIALENATGLSVMQRAPVRARVISGRGVVSQRLLGMGGH
jgi:hypothetical protein